MIRKFCLLILFCPFVSLSQPITNAGVLTGAVFSHTTPPVALAGVDLVLLKSKYRAISGSDGQFILRLGSLPDTLEISLTGYTTRRMLITQSTSLEIMLEPGTHTLQDVVVSTGYQSLTRQRTAGSFVQVDQSLFNRRVSFDLLSRLEDNVPGLVFQKPVTAQGTLPANEKLGINIRGRSTIDDKVSADPLIIIDNFPYEGNINNLNPNDVESVTVLKDAAAAAIWGSRSANGVIVVTTKKAAYNQALKLSFTANTTFSGKPDLSYSRRFLNSRDYIELETFLFSKGFFDADLKNTTNRPVVSPVIEILAKQRAGQISATEADAQLSVLQTRDVRNDFARYVYRHPLNQQYSLSMRGGTRNNRYSMSVGYDNNTDNLVRVGNDRFTLNALSIFQPLAGLEITAGILYSRSQATANNPSSYGGIPVGGNYGSLFPYASLVDANGDPAIVTRDYRAGYADSMQQLGFLNWTYRPLEEINAADNTSTIQDLLLRTAAKYRIGNSLAASLQYQEERQFTTTNRYNSLETYYTRNLVNRFSVRNAATGNFTYQLPKGGILQLGENQLTTWNLRGQLEWNSRLKDGHNINALVGAELTSGYTSGYSRLSYGYDDTNGTSVSNLNYASPVPVNPVGNSTISAPDGSISGTNKRLVSYYANASWLWKEKYTVTGSVRKDGANIFGVNTNDQFVPLWSAAAGWEMSKESWFRFSLFPYLRLRASYGYNGNVYNASAYLTAIFRTSTLTGLPYATVSAPPNPLLRWERVGNTNLGLDFTLQKNRLSGTLEWYQKKATDLIESAPLAPSTGFTSFKGNAAALTTKGIDLTLNSENLRGALHWRTSLLLSTVKDKVVTFDTRYQPVTLADANPSSGTPAATGVYAVEGRSLFGVYAYRWAGLDPSNGDPQGYLNGQVSKDYTGIINNTPMDSLVYFGSSRPEISSSLRNSFGWKNWSLSFTVTGKFHYFFRRRSTPLNYQSVLSTPNSDYSLRWQQPGDEQHTYIPSLSYPANTNRNRFFQNSEPLVEKADHIRLKDITLSYTFSKAAYRRLPFEKMECYLYTSNLGLLWKANQAGLDPEAVDNIFNSVYPAVFTLSAGVRIDF